MKQFALPKTFMSTVFLTSRRTFVQIFSRLFICVDEQQTIVYLSAGGIAFSIKFDIFSNNEAICAT